MYKMWLKIIVLNLASKVARELGSFIFCYLASSLAMDG